MTKDNQCAICDRLTDPVYEDDHWRVRHSSETDILGYFLLESRRHILDLSEATEDESASLGPLLGRLQRAIKETVHAERVYIVSIGEAVPHFHLHLIPRNDKIPRGFRGRGILAYPLEPSASEVLVKETCKQMVRSLKRNFMPIR